MKDLDSKPAIERRWPVAVAILAVVLLLTVLPRSVRLLPMWMTYVIGGAVILPIVVVGLTAARTPWLRIERTVTLLFFVVTAILTVANLVNLLYAMARHSAEITGVQLLASSIGVWATNVLMFSLLYWQMDRGGPEARVRRRGKPVDWLFPQEGAPAGDVPEDWRPTFVDYLFLAYATATAFSTTDVMPLTPRAKLLMMFESTISLFTILVVAARAINIFGG